MPTKTEKLGVPYGTACNRLRRSIMFHLAQQCGRLRCIRCSEPIKTVKEFTIDHIQAWLKSESPIELFFDINNIGFSHTKCNQDARDKSTSGAHWRAKTHCPHGHPYSGHNLVVWRDGRRRCRTCHNKQAHASRAGW